VALLLILLGIKLLILGGAAVHRCVALDSYQGIASAMPLALRN
jgi:hypothetical protein